MINVDFIFIEFWSASIRDDQRSESDILASINGIVLSKFIWLTVFCVTETVLCHFKNSKSKAGWVIVVVSEFFL
jgi:hypothetical protein